MDNYKRMEQVDAIVKNYEHYIRHNTDEHEYCCSSVGINESDSDEIVKSVVRKLITKGYNVKYDYYYGCIKLISKIKISEVDFPDTNNYGDPNDKDSAFIRLNNPQPGEDYLLPYRIDKLKVLNTNELIEYVKNQVDKLPCSCCTFFYIRLTMKAIDVVCTDPDVKADLMDMLLRYARYAEYVRHH